MLAYRNMDIFHLANYSFNPYAVPVSVSAFIVLALGTFVWQKDKRNPIHSSFLFLTFTLFIWLFGYTLIYLTPHPSIALFWGRMTYLGIVFISPTTFLLTAILTQTARKMGKLIYTFFLIAVLFLPFALFSPAFLSDTKLFYWGLYPQYGFLGVIFNVFFFVPMLGSFYLLWVTTHLEGYSERGKKHLRIMLMGLLILYTGSVDYLPKYGVEFYPSGYLSVLLFVIVIAYAIVAYRLMDIQTVVHKTVLWLMVSLLIILPVSGLFYLSHNWIMGLGPLQISLLAAGLTLFLIPYTKVILPRIDHLFQRRQYDLQRELQAFIYEISELKGLDELVSKVQTTVASILYTEKTSLILFDVHAEDLNASLLYSLPSPFSVERHHDFLKWLECENNIVEMDFIDHDPKYAEIGERGKNYFADVHGNLVLPLVHDGKLLGVLNLDQKSNLKPYTDTDIEFLFTIKLEVSTALSNALLYADVCKMSDALQESSRKLEARVEERTSELTRANKEMEAFTYTVSHDLRAPVRALLGYSNILVEEYTDKLDAEGQRFLKVLQEESAHIGNMIDDLLNFSRLGHGAVNRSDIDMNKFVRTVVAKLRALEPDRSITVNILDLPKVVGGPVLLVHVFTNLISNAFKYTSKNKQAVVTIGSQNLPGESVYFVADNGVGFDMRYVGKLFNVFQRLHTASEFPGNGVGLAIVDRIIQKHKGRVWAEGKLNEGATFYVALPIEIIL